MWVCVCVLSVYVYVCLSMCVCALLFVCSQALVRVQRLLQLDAISRGCRSALPCPALLSHLSTSPYCPLSLFSHNTYLSVLLLPFNLLAHLSTLLSLSVVIFLNGFWCKIYACLLQFLSKSMHVCMCECVCVCVLVCVLLWVHSANNAHNLSLSKHAHSN